MFWILDSGAIQVNDFWRRLAQRTSTGGRDGLTYAAWWPTATAGRGSPWAIGRTSADLLRNAQSQGVRPPPTRWARASRAPRRPSTPSPTLLRPRSPSCPAQRAPSSPAVAILWPSLPSAPSSINGDPGTRPPTFQQDSRKTQAPHPPPPPSLVDNPPLWRQPHARGPRADTRTPRRNQVPGTLRGAPCAGTLRGGSRPTLRSHGRVCPTMIAAALRDT
jgi:hypothetical protein